MREDWIECTLDEVCEVLDNLRKPINSTERNERIKGKDKSNLFPYYGATGQVGYIDDFLTDGDYVLLGEDAAPFLDFTKDVAYKITGKTWVNNHAHILKSHFNDAFLLHFLNQFQYRDYVTGTTRLKLTQGALKRMPVKLAPLPIQRVIVSKIEALFSDLDNGIANFKKAQEQLKIYRQAVLKKAFEGELTKEWREKQTNLPTAEELLKQIKEERQNHYNQQMENWKKAVKVWEKNKQIGKKPIKPKVWKDVEAFTELEKYDFNVLPENWNWVKLGNIFQVFIGSTPSRKNNSFWVDGNINWVSSGEVAFNSIYATKEKITESGLLNTSTTVHPKGTVMLAMIGEGKTRGQAAILEIEACHNQNTAAIRVSEVGFEPKFLYHYLFLKYEKNRRVGSGNNQKALNQSRIMEFDFPLCSLEEQTQIVQEIEFRLSVCDKVEQSITESIIKAEALRQSILKKAFEGKLLSQAEIELCKTAADYEPASELLKKIQAEKLAAAQEKKKPSIKKKSKK